MKNNLLKSNKGSTLVIVMFAMMILSMLGITLISLALTNYKMKLMDKKVKESFYLADAGLEEAYALIEKSINEVIQEIIDNEDELIYEPLNHYIETQISAIEEGLEEDEDVEDIISDVTDDVIQYYFNKAFREKVNSYGTDGLMNYVDNNLDNVIKVDVESYSFSQVPSIDTYLENAAEYEDDIYKITLKSISSIDNIEKIVESTFTVSIPKYGDLFIVEGNQKPYEIESIPDNVLWHKALIAMQDLIVIGNVRINGDIYAYGNDDEINNKNPMNYGGIVVGYEGIPGRLTVVNGDIISDKYLHTKASNSSIDVQNGNVYCKSLVINDIGDDDENCTMMINGDVNTYDDIKLNGEKSSITINGSYFGFSFGADGYDKSSSIIINSDDISISDKTYIRITGNGLGKDYYPDDNKNGIFLGGVVHINLYEDTYQTGESVAIKGNYRAYTQEITSPLKYSELHKDKVAFSFKSPLYLVDKIVDPEPERDLTVWDKVKYFMEVYWKDEGKSDDEKIISTGELKDTGVGQIDLKNIKYSTGAYITKDESTSKGIVGYFENALNLFSNTFAEKFQQNLEEYAYYTKKLGDPQKTVEDVHQEMITESYEEIQRILIDQRFTYNENIDDFGMHENEIIYNSQDSIPVVIKQTGFELPIQINGDYDQYEFGSTVNGIIVTKGDIYIAGNITFNGIIATEGNLYVIGDGNNEVTINHDYEYTIEKVFEGIEDDNLKIGDLFYVPEDEVNKKIFYVTKSYSNTNFHKKKYVDIASWEQKM